MTGSEDQNRPIYGQIFYIYIYIVLLLLVYLKVFFMCMLYIFMKCLLEDNLKCNQHMHQLMNSDFVECD